MLRCDLRCLLTSSVKELRLAPQCRAPLSSIGRSNVAIIGVQREVAHVALRILLPVAMASILSLESTAAILPQSPGQKLTIGCWVSFIDCLGLTTFLPPRQKHAQNVEWSWRYPPELLCHAKVIANSIVFGDRAICDSKPVRLPHCETSPLRRESVGHTSVGSVVHDKWPMLASVQGHASNRPISHHQDFMKFEAHVGERAV